MTELRAGDHVRHVASGHLGVVHKIVPWDGGIYVPVVVLWLSGTKELVPDFELEKEVYGSAG